MRKKYLCNSLSMGFFLAGIFIMLFLSQNSSNITGAAIGVSALAFENLYFGFILIISAGTIFTLSVLEKQKLEEITEEETKSRKEIGRREFIKRLAVVSVAAKLGLSLPNPAFGSKQKAPLNKEALLYDLYLGSYKNKSNANKRKEEIEGILNNTPELLKNLEVVSEGKYYKVKLDINTIADDTKAIINGLKKNKVDAFRQLNSCYFNDKVNAGRYALLLIEGSLSNTVKKYTTAYDSREIQITANSIMKINDKRKLRDGDLVKVPVRFLKIPHQLGMVEERDFHAVKLRKGQNLFNIASEYTIGDINYNVEILRKFNEIKKNQMSKLIPGTTIIIPSSVYHDPGTPKRIAPVSEGSDTYKIVRSVEKTSPAEKDSERENKSRVLAKRIPEASLSAIHAHLKTTTRSGVIRDTNMPAVVTEAFNINNFEQLKFYSNDKNLKALAEAYGRGIIDYKKNHKPSLRLVIIDNGHGEHGPGTKDRVHGTGKTERDFTKKIQKYLANYLRKKGMKVKELNYTGEVNATERVNYYSREANKIGSQNTSVYISTHVNGLETEKGEIITTKKPPEIFIHGKGKQTFSDLLAREMLEEALKLYK